MSFEDPDWREAFFRLHSGLAREAPGSDQTTLRALEMVGPAPVRRVLDAGCGPGAASAALLDALPAAEVVGMDTHAPFVEAARARAFAMGAGARFEGIVGDMAAPEGPFDLIWCEGAIYFLGVEAGLAGWRGALAPGGRVVFSDAVWLTDAPSPEAVAFWRAYPAMTDPKGVEAAVARAGYRAEAAFVQPKGDWDAYLGAVEARAEALADEIGATPAGLAVLEEARREAATWRACRGEYGYLMVLAVPA